MTGPARILRGRSRLVALVCIGVLGLGAAASVRADAGSAKPDPVERLPDPARSQRIEACARLASMPFPGSAAELEAALRRLENARDACSDQPSFLALLGGLWLEQGDATRALLWLERSLLLDPDQAAAQADHALALAALGDVTARDELLRRWRDRADVPPLLWARLVHTQPRTVPASAPSPWVRLRELTLLYGYESNLDQSARLDELTITPPDGPIDLPLSEPLRPRPGAAGLVDASWQVAYNPGGGLRLQAGAQASARAASSQRSTDWHSLQLVASASQRWHSLRGQLQFGYTAFGGNLNEPYELQRLGLLLESNGLGCLQRIAADHEARRQRSSALHDGDSSGLSLGVQCPLPPADDWLLGIALRGVIDRPRNAERPGGAQRQYSLGLKLAGPAFAGWRAEFNLRSARSIDDLGFSDLLVDNDRRWMRLDQVQVELSRPVRLSQDHVADSVLQLHHARQRSNIPIFSYTSSGLFAGLRWRW